MDRRSLLFAIGLLSEGALAQDTFQRTYGNAGNEIANDVKLTSDGGYIFAGSAENDAMLLRTDADGDTLWYRVYGGSSLEMFSAVDQTIDGGFIASGSIGGFPFFDAYAVKVDANGVLQWSKSYGYTGEDAAHEQVATADGGALLVGQVRLPAQSAVFLIRIDQNGDTIWTKGFEGSTTLTAVDVCETGDGDFMIVGNTYDAFPGTQDSDILAMKITASGNVVWARTYGGQSPENLADEGDALAPSADGGYVIAGRSSNFSDELDNVLLKIDDAGNVQWAKRYSSSPEDYAYAVAVVEDGGYIMAGVSSSDLGGSAFGYALRTDESGDTLWTRAYGFDDVQYIEAAVALPSGGFLFGGLVVTGAPEQLDIYAIRTDGTGMSWCSEHPTETIVSDVTFESDTVELQVRHGYHATDNTGVITGGASLGIICLTTDVAAAGRGTTEFLTYPQPSEGVIRFGSPFGRVPIYAEVTDVLGGLVHRQWLAPALEHMMDLGGLPTGTYALHLQYQEARVICLVLLRR